jgi:hypothetical protein
MPRLNLTVEERARLIAAMEKASRDMRLTKTLRVEATQGGLDLCRMRSVCVA